MSGDAETTTGPLVSVLVPTFNRRRYLKEALAGLIGQTYGRFEAIVVNDGGEPVADVVERFADPRLALIERRETRGKAASLNEALEHASGKYVAYLDDDLYYPQHLARLVGAMEGDPDCGAAYTDLYKVHCRILPGGARQVRGKVVNDSRDFDRFFLCYCGHALHVSLMHRRDLLERTGPYNERLSILIDWDMVRRLAFYTDFKHIREVTGEFTAPAGEPDRIWHAGRLDRQAFLADMLMIRTTRPPKPWPRMPDLSIVALPERIDELAAEMIRQIYAVTFMPFEVYLPAAPSDLARLKIDMPNLVTVPATRGASLQARLDAALAHLGGDYVAVVPQGVPLTILWVEDALHAALHDPTGRTAFTLCGHEAARPAFVLDAAQLRRAREGCGDLPLAESFRAAGIEVRDPRPREWALGFDRVLQGAESLEEDGNWVQAAALYKQIPPRFGNERWMRERAAAALYGAGGRDEEAIEIVRDLNRDRATVSTLLLEARIRRRGDRLREAVGLLERARLILKR